MIVLPLLNNWMNWKNIITIDISDLAFNINNLKYFLNLYSIEHTSNKDYLQFLPVTNSLACHLKANSVLNNEPYDPAINSHNFVFFFLL